MDRLHIDNFDIYLNLNLLMFLYVFFLRCESVIYNDSSTGGSSSRHYYPMNLNSLGHGICVPEKIYRPQRDSNPVPPGSKSTTLLMSYPGTLPMPWRWPPDIPYTLRPPVGSR